MELPLKAISIYNELDDNEKAIEFFNCVIAIIQKTLGHEHESLVVPLKNMVYMVLEEGRFKELSLQCLGFTTLFLSSAIVLSFVKFVG